MPRTLTLSVLAIALALSAAPQAAAAAPDADPIAAMRAALGRGDKDAAIAAGEAATASPNASSEVWHWLGIAYCDKALSASLLSRLGLAKKCLAAYEKAVALDPQNVGARSDLAEYYIEAPGIAGGDKAKARAQAVEIAKLDAVRGHLLLGQIEAKDENFAASEAAFKRAIAENGKDPRGTLALGNLYVAQKRWDDATALWRLHLTSGAGLELIAHYQLGKIALLSGQGLSEGAEHLRTYLRSPAPPNSPTWADAHWRLALVLEKLGKRDEALAELREALKLNPKHEQATKDLDRLGG
jgi:tetratricopeptide (TPR) repeat protein